MGKLNGSRHNRLPSLERPSRPRCTSAPARPGTSPPPRPCIALGRRRCRLLLLESQNKVLRPMSSSVFAKETRRGPRSSCAFAAALPCAARSCSQLLAYSRRDARARTAAPPRWATLAPPPPPLRCRSSPCSRPLSRRCRRRPSHPAPPAISPATLLREHRVAATRTWLRACASLIFTRASPCGSSPHCFCLFRCPSCCPASWSCSSPAPRKRSAVAVCEELSLSCMAWSLLPPRCCCCCCRRCRRCAAAPRASSDVSTRTF